jgi:hypothetical protein
MDAPVIIRVNFEENTRENLQIKRSKNIFVRRIYPEVSFHQQIFNYPE